MSDFADEAAMNEELYRNLALRKAQQVKQDPLPDCEECGDPIPEERQKAINARPCVGCAEVREAAGRHFYREQLFLGRSDAGASVRCVCLRRDLWAAAMSIELLHMDCMDYMRGLPDKAFELAIVDPPYGVGGDSIHAGRISKGSGKLKGRAIQNGDTSWDVAPDDGYFLELFRVSRNQVIWGGNYFDFLGRSRGFAIWDKCQPWPNFSACEFAWTSFDCPSKLVKIDNRTSDKIHPTQKPVKLYEWLLSNYAKPGDRILDTHLGSGSSAIAAHKMGFDFVGMELDKDYYDAACKRFELETAQEDMFAGGV